jgi:hypothetical protein
LPRKKNVAPRVVELTTSTATEEVTAATTIRELEEARRLALANKQPAPAVSAALAKARIAGLIGRKAETRPVRTAKFEGTDAEAVRRIAFLLGLAERETSGEQKP